MAIKLSDKPNVEAPSVDYQFGSIQDVSLGVPGTPVSRGVYGDLHQFFEMLMHKSEINHNDLPDNNTNGYQLFEAFMRLANGRSYENSYKINQTGSSDPTVENIGVQHLLPGNNITGTRVGVGEYEFYSSPNWFPAVSPDGLQLIASSGTIECLPDTTINCRFEDGIIKMSVKISGTPVDGAFGNYVFTIRYFPDSLY